MLLRAARVRESPMRERSALPTPCSPNAQSPPWQALAASSSTRDTCNTYVQDSRSTSSSRHIKSKSNQHQINIKLKSPTRTTPYTPHPTHEEGGGGGEDAVTWPMRPRAPPPLWGPSRAPQRWSPRCRPDAERGSRSGCPWEDEESLASCEAWASLAEPLHWPNRGVWG
ncbi:hypothetical protein T484DRAFT_1983883 [Baffinella frigidus]|nr:hypothetical protein T484DRAFT_1983883 [Cryptophyta sp. CCMP2293]